MSEINEAGVVVDGYRWDGSQWLPVSGVTVDGYRWDGVQWAPVPGVTVDGYRWDGAAWVPVEHETVDGYRWDGTQWVATAGAAGRGADEDGPRPVLPPEPEAPPKSSGPRVPPLHRRPWFWVLASLGALVLLWLAYPRPSSTAPAPESSWLVPSWAESAPTDSGDMVVEVGGSPAAIALDPTSGAAIVANTGDPDGQFSLSLLDNEHDVTGVVALGSSQPIGLALDPGTGTLYIAHLGESQRVLVMDLATHVVRADVLEGQKCGPLAFDSAHGMLVCASGHAVSFVDAATLKRVKTVRVGREPSALALDPGRHRLYVGDFNTTTYGGNITVVDTETYRVVDSIMFDEQVTGLAVDAEHRLYVAPGSGGSVAVLSPETQKVLAQIPIPGYSMGLAVDPQRKLLYVSNYQESSVSIIPIE